MMNWLNPHSSNESDLNWNLLESESQLETLIEQSHQKPVAIFKHSVRCGISAMVKAQLEATWDVTPEAVDLYYLDLIQYRTVSNLIAERLGVWHQSPQLILIQNGKATYHASHQAIQVAKMKNVLVG